MRGSASQQYRARCSGRWRPRRDRCSGRGTRLAVRSLSRDQHDAGLNFGADFEDETDRSAIVVEAHALAVTEPTGASLLGVQDAAWRTLAPAQKRDAGESGVALKVTRRGQQAQRPTRRLALVLRIGLPVRQRRKTLRGESF
jgi:hypothetical protein